MIEGLAHRDFEPTLRGLLGEEAPLSASTIARLNAEYGAESDAWKRRRLESEHFIYLWPVASISARVLKTNGVFSSC